MRRPLATASLLAAACSMGGGAFAQSITASGDVTVDQQPRSGQLGNPLVAFDVGIGSGPEGRSGRLVLGDGATTDIGGSVRVGEGPEATLGLLEVSGFGTGLNAQSLRLGERSGRGILRLTEGGAVDLNGRFEVGTQSLSGGGSSFTIGGFATLAAGDSALSNGRGFVEDAGLLRGGSKLALGDGGRFDLDVGPGGRIEASFLEVGGSNGGSLTSTLTLGGDADLLRDGFINPGSRLSLEGGSLSAFRLENNGGALTGSGRINANLRLLASGSGSRSRVSLLAGETLEVRGNQTDTLTSDSGLIENAGTLDVGDGMLVNLNESSYLGRGGTFRGSNFINNGGASAVDLLSGANAFASAFENRQGGRVTVTGGATAAFQEAVRNNGAFRVDPGSRATFVGRYSGAGDLSGGGETVFLGGLSIGNSAAVVNVGTQVINDANSEFLLELGGTDREAVEFDAFNIQPGGSFEFQGSPLRVTLLGDFEPTLGAEFEIFRFESFAMIPVSGGFGDVILAELEGGLSLDVSTLLSDGFIRVVPEPGSAALLLGGAGLLLRRRGTGRG